MIILYYHSFEYLVHELHASDAETLQCIARTYGDFIVFAFLLNKVDLF